MFVGGGEWDVVCVSDWDVYGVCVCGECGECGVVVVLRGVRRGVGRGVGVRGVFRDVRKV